MRRDQSIALQLLLLVSAGLLLRLAPLAFSRLPYNIDGFPLARLSERMIETGRWEVGGGGLLGYNSAMPGFSLLLAGFSLVTGMAPLDAAPYFVPVYTVGTIVAVYAITLKLTKSQLAAFFAGAFLAASGFYVYLTAAAMKEAVGLALLPLLAWSFHRRADARERAIAAAILLLLPLVHHLTTLVALTMVAMLAAVDWSRKLAEGRLSARAVALDVALGPALGLVAIWYYRGVGLSTMSQLSSVNDVASYLSVMLVLTIGAIALARPASTKPWFVVGGSGNAGKLARLLDEKALVLAGGICVVVLNNAFNLFGAIRTTDRFLELVLPYLALAFTALLGFNLARYAKGEARTLLPTLFLAPLTTVMFALLKGLDPITFALVYRSYDYADLGIALCAGMGLAFLINHASKASGRRGGTAKVAAIAACLALVASTAPLAYSWQEVYGVESVTAGSELEAMRFASGYANCTIGTDQRLADIMNPCCGAKTDDTIIWQLSRGKELAGVGALFLERRWTSDGAQVAPFGNVVVPQRHFDSAVAKGDLVYCGGSGERQALLVLLC